jgi:hypothetical protein
VNETERLASELLMEETTGALATVRILGVAVKLEVEAPDCPL